MINAKQRRQSWKSKYEFWVQGECKLLNEVAGDTFAAKGNFEPTFGGGGEVWETKSLLGEGKSKCQGPEVGNGPVWTG